jgi:homoserine dehydrogenase
MTGPVTLTGKGAGSHPTASAVVSDIVRIALRPASPEGAIRFDGDASYIRPGERVSRYYMRVHTEDSPGILANIAGVLADHRISIASVIQKESELPHVPLVIMTHEAHEEGLFAAVERINAFDFVEGDATVLRVEDYQSDGADDE